MARRPGGPSIVGRTSQGYPIPEPPDRLSGAARAGYRLIRAGLWGWSRLWLRLEVEGRDRLPMAGPYLLAPVHRSNLDFLLTAVAADRPVRFMAKDSIWRVWWFARLFTWFGAFPVKRQVVDRAALRWTEAALEAGEPVVIFPEGGRRSGPVVKELQSGVAWTACRSRVPIVPVAIGGSERAMPIGSWWVRPTRVRVVVGEPIHPEVPVQGRVSRGDVDRLSATLRAELQRLYDRVR